MAERTSARSTRQRTATQSPTLPRPLHSPARRSNRVTRSQSREISDTDAEQTGAKRTRARSKKSGSISNGETTLQNKERKEGRSTRVNRAGPLQGENGILDKTCVRRIQESGAFNRLQAIFGYTCSQLPILI